MLDQTSEFLRLGTQSVGVQMVLKEGGLLSLCLGVPLLSMVRVQMILKEGGLLSLYLCIGVLYG